MTPEKQAHHYQAFGEHLASDIPFPELAPRAPTEARWSLTVDPELPDAPEHQLLGRAHMYDDIDARLIRDEAGIYWFEIDDTGRFRFDPRVGQIHFRPIPDASWDFVRSHFLGGVLGVLFHLAGEITLHASAVHGPEGTLGFLAPKGAGKSTLALSLVRRGYRLVTDDDLVIRTDGPPTARPGIPAPRLTHASRARLDVLPDEPDGPDGKAALRTLPERDIESDTTRLAALYLIASPDAGAHTSDAPVRRTRLPTHEAALLLHGQEKIGVLLGSGEAPVLLDLAIRIAERVPVYRLDLLRDMDRLDEVADRIAEWHRTEPAP